MAAVRLDRFRLISGLSESQLPSDLALLALRSASVLANRFCGRHFGDVVESISASGSNATILIPGHGFDPSGTMLLLGTQNPGLTGEVAYQVVDESTLSVAGVTTTQPITKGFAAKRIVSKSRVMDMIATIAPSPVAMVKEVRMRSVGQDDGPFPSSSALVSSEWFCDTREPSLSGELEVYRNVLVRKRVPGMIQPVVQRSLKEIEVTYYAGFIRGIPEDLQTAICSIAKELATDSSGHFAQESYEDYSYQRMDPELLRRLPASALSTLARYQVPY
jgi:hypothetical protein